MILESLESIHELPESEGHKIGIFCFCGGALKTVSGEFSIESGTSIGRDETVRCVVNPDHEFDFDDYERLKCEAIGHSATPVNQDRVCA